MIKILAARTCIFLALLLSLSACSSDGLDTKESCALIDKLSVEQSIEQKWALAHLGILAQNTQPAVEALGAAINIYREVAEQTGDKTLATALESEIGNFERLKGVIANRAFDDPQLMPELEAAKAKMDYQYTDYVPQVCPGSIADPDRFVP